MEPWNARRPWNARLVSSCMATTGFGQGMERLDSTQCRSRLLQGGAFSASWCGRGSDPGAARQALNQIAITNLERVPTPRLELYLAEGFLAAPECARLIEVMNGRLRAAPPSRDDEPRQVFPPQPDLRSQPYRRPGGPAAGQPDLRGDADSPGARRAVAGPVLRSRATSSRDTRLLRGLRARKFSTPAWGQRSWRS